MKAKKRSKKKQTQKFWSINDDCKNTTENKCRQKQALLTIKHFVAFLYSLFLSILFLFHTLCSLFLCPTSTKRRYAVCLFYVLKTPSPIWWYFSMEFFSSRQVSNKSWQCAIFNLILLEELRGKFIYSEKKNNLHTSSSTERSSEQ